MSILDTPEAWPPDSTESVFFARALSKLSHDVAWAALRSGELVPRVYCVGRTDWGPVPISPTVFVNTERAQVFTTCQIEVCDTDRRRPARVRRRIPVPHWLYVTRESLDKLSKPAVKPEPSNPLQRRTRPTAAAYAEHWKQFEMREGKHPSREDDSKWAKANGHTVKHVLNVLRKGHVAALPAGKKPTDGPRKPRALVPRTRN